MRTILVFFLLVGSLNVMAEVVEVKVSGMVCSMCAQGIQKKFSTQDSVKKLNIDMDNKIVSIEMKEGTSMNDETISKLITEAGYNVANITRK
jgi:copper chaperone CopZ